MKTDFLPPIPFICKVSDTYMCVDHRNLSLLKLRYQTLHWNLMSNIIFKKKKSSATDKIDQLNH